MTVYMIFIEFDGSKPSLDLGNLPKSTVWDPWHPAPCASHVHGGAGPRWGPHKREKGEIREREDGRLGANPRGLIHSFG